MKHKRGLADEAIQSIEDEIQNLYIKVKILTLLLSPVLCSENHRKRVRRVSVIYKHTGHDKETGGLFEKIKRYTCPILLYLLPSFLVGSEMTTESLNNR